MVSPGHLAADDREAIRELVARYGHVVDAADWPALDQVFTAGAVWDATGVGAERVEGIGAIRAWYAKTAHPLGHHTTNVLITPLDPDSAEVRSKYIVVLPHGKAVTGEYRDVAVRTSVGWRFASRAPRRMKKAARG